MRTARWAVLGAVLTALLAGSRAAQAADFRIETRLCIPEEETPISESFTLFDDGVVYDYRQHDGRVTIYRPASGDARGRFVLLDTNRGLRTEVDVAQVDAVIAKLRRWAAAQEDPFLRFTGDPRFKESFDPATGELRLESDQMTYRLVTMPVASTEAMQQFREFLDEFVKLQTLLDSGLPPQPRLRVNESLARHKVAPVEVELISRGLDKPSVRCEHLITWMLSKSDRSRIDETLDQLTEYREVTNAEFQDSRIADRR